MFVWRYWPDTKGATLEDIGLAFGDEVVLDESSPEGDQYTKRRTTTTVPTCGLVQERSIAKVGRNEKSLVRHDVTAFAPSEKTFCTELNSMVQI
jgi:hypothetical protein